MKGIDNFIGSYPTPATQKMYRSAIHQFVECMYGRHRKGRRGTPEELKTLNDLSSRYLKEERDYAQDLLQFARDLHKKPPMTGKSYLIAVREWMIYNDIEISAKNIKLIRRMTPKGGSSSAEDDLDIPTLERILQHTDVKGRAFFLVMESSGMRVGEALQIKFEDIDLTVEPVPINLRQEYTKGQSKRTTFIGREAVKALKEWLSVRDKYLVSSANRNKGLVGVGIGNLKPETDDRIFPFSPNTAEQMWVNAITNAGLLSVDKSTNRKGLRIHQLRKVFRSQLALGAPVDIVEMLMGHEGYLTDVYRRYSRQQLAEYYKKHEALLYINKSDDTQRIETEFSDINTKNKTLEAEVIALRELSNVQFSQMMQLKAQVEELILDLKVSDLADHRKLPYTNQARTLKTS